MFGLLKQKCPTKTRAELQELVAGCIEECLAEQPVLHSREVKEAVEKLNQAGELIEATPPLSQPEFAYSPLINPWIVTSKTIKHAPIRTLIEELFQDSHPDSHIRLDFEPKGFYANNRIYYTDEKTVRDYLKARTEFIEKIAKYKVDLRP